MDASACPHCLFSKGNPRYPFFLSWVDPSAGRSAEIQPEHKIKPDTIMLAGGCTNHYTTMAPIKNLKKKTKKPHIFFTNNDILTITLPYICRLIGEISKLIKAEGVYFSLLAVMPQRLLVILVTVLSLPHVIQSQVNPAFTQSPANVNLGSNNVCKYNANLSILNA